MPQKTPSMVMYAALKSHGISNHEAATLLLNTKLTFDGRMIQDRVDESSQLSRRIVRTTPGTLPITLFNDFHLTCPQLATRLTKDIASTDCNGDLEVAAAQLSAQFSGAYARQMAIALTTYGVNDAQYRNMVSYINYAELPNESSRVILHMLLFVITGCVGDPRTASVLTIDFASRFLGADFHTAPTVVGNPSGEAVLPAKTTLGLIRITGKYVRTGARTHVMNPNGTEIGFLPATRHTVTDVGEDVSRRHAYLWREGDRWLIKDLGSTNGTRILDGATGEYITVTTEGEPHEVHPTDVICLGGTTRFLVIPLMSE